MNITHNRSVINLVFAACMLLFLFGCSDNTPQNKDIPQSSGEVDVTKLMTQGALQDIFIGKSDAKVTIVEYASMTCPHCAHFHKTTLPTLKEKYLDTGKARLVLREFPFDPRATAAFMLARCSGEEKYYPMVDILFSQQDSWTQASDAKVEMLRLAKLAGFSEESFNACLSDQKLLNQINDGRDKAAKDFEVSSTPTFFINGKKYQGALSIEEISAIIDSL